MHGISPCTEPIVKPHSPISSDSVEARTMGGNNGALSCGGVLFDNSKIRFADITDGSAFTIAVWEQSDYFIGSDHGTKYDRRNCNNHGWMIGTRDNSLLRKGDDRTFNYTTMRHRINCKSCFSRSQLSNNSVGMQQNSPVNSPPISAHPAVALAVFSDGSVHAVPETTDLTQVFRLCTRDDGQVVEVP